jgi:hypothetical protein
MVVRHYRLPIHDQTDHAFCPSLWAGDKIEWNQELEIMEKKREKGRWEGRKKKVPHSWARDMV